jgi:hypothetical protein
MITLLLPWVITLLVVSLLAAFVFYLVGLGALPVDRRPLTRTYDRLGRYIGVTEKPDYHENPGENDADGET